MNPILTKVPAYSPGSDTPETNFEERFGTVLESVLRVLKKEKTSGRIEGARIIGDLIELAIPPILAIVGDLHGDIGTLQKILSRLEERQFFEDPKNKLVLLGDYVDRGKNSIIVLHALFRLKGEYPDSVILMRGNHEAPHLFPFRQHDLPAYLEANFFTGRALYDKLLSVFDQLAIGVIVKDRILLVHGGVPTSAPRSDSNEILCKATKDKKILEEILWNDPKDLRAGIPFEKSRRSYGFHFGETVTDKWLGATGTRILVRGHEPCQGYDIRHSGKAMTLFSCQESYPGHKAAFLLLSKSDVDTLNTASDLIANIHML